jgi:hypothetical protein
VVVSLQETGGIPMGTNCAPLLGKWCNLGIEQNEGRSRSSSGVEIQNERDTKYDFP